MRQAAQSPMPEVLRNTAVGSVFRKRQDALPARLMVISILPMWKPLFQTKETC